MKKILSIFAFVLLLTSLVACGDKPEEILAQAEDQLALAFATGDSATSVTQDLETLPTTIGDVVITWESSNTTYLSNDGKVTRGESDVNVTLTATLTYEGLEVEVPIVLTIKADSLADLVTAFEASYAATLGNDEFEATDDLTLVTTFQGATVTWSSNNTEIITNAGVVTRPAYAVGDQTVILTATLTQGLLDEEVEFLVLVPKLELTISEKLQQALLIATAFPVVDGISTDQVFVTTAKDSLNNEYTVVWTSSHPDILSATGVVTQPDDADVVVTMTASITFENVTETKTVTFNVFKKADNTVYAETIAEAIAAVTFEEGKYTTTYPTVFEKLTVLGKLDDSYIVTDGTDVLIVFSTVVAFEVGKVYEVSGAIQDYFGVYEIVPNGNVALTGTLLAEETPVYPTPEVVTDINAWLTAQPTFDENAYYRHDIITVTARVYVQETGVASNYNTYLVSPTWEDWDNSAVNLVTDTTYAAPTIMIYYKSDIEVLRPLDGKIVTIDIVMQSYRDDLYVWYGNFMGTIDDVEIVLNDQESVDTAEAQIKALIDPQYVENTTVDLPETLFGATIVWSSSNETTFNSKTGVVTLPTTGVDTVTLSAVITKNDATKTVTINTNVGDVELIDISALYDSETTLVEGDYIKIKGLLVAQNSTSSWWIQDATAGLNIYVPYDLRATFATYELGIEVQITGLYGLNNGLVQIEGFTAEGVEITNATPAALPAPKSITEVAFTNEALYDYMGQLVSFEGFVLKETVTATSSYVNFVLVDPISGEEVAAFLHKDAKNYAAALAGIKEFVGGDAVDVTGVILGWNSGKYQIVVTDDHFSAGTAYTEAQLAAYAESKLTVPAADAEVDANLTLPTTGLFGSTVAWTSSNTTAITVEGVVTRGATDVQVTLGYTVTLGSTTLTEKTISVTVLADVPVTLTHNYNLADLTTATSYVTEPTATELTNLVDMATSAFTRFAANISTRTSGEISNKGVVLALRSSTSYAAAYIESDFAVANLAKIDFKFSIWSTDYSYNGDAMESFQVQVSTDGTTWTTVHDAKSIITATADATYNVSVELETPGNYYVRIIMNPTADAATILTTYSLRVIVQEIKFYS